MGRRLKIAKKLLSDRGVIFISIDDNEQAQLKMLCDEILHNIDLLQQYLGVKELRNRMYHIIYHRTMNGYYVLLIKNF